MNLRSYMRRILDGHRVGTTERIYPGFLNFERPVRPSWWPREPVQSDWGEVLGVHEYQTDTRDRAIVVAERGLVILAGDAAATWVPYADIARWDRLSKSPVSKSLVVWTTTGGRVELLFDERGGAFTFVQYLGGAMWATKRLTQDTGPRR